MDIHSKAKNKVLEELISMMEERELGELKGKSPKFAKVDIESDDPELMDEIKDKLMDKDSDEDEMELDKESPTVSEEDEDDLERLKELYSKLN